MYTHTLKYSILNIFFLMASQRFLPSDFGCEEDRVTPLPPFEDFLDKKRKIRRVIEAAGIPYTFVSANCYGAYFVNYLLRPHEKKDDVVVYGSGKAKGMPIINFLLPKTFLKLDKTMFVP